MEKRTLNVRKKGNEEETIEIDVLESLKKDVENFIKDRPELGFKSVDEFVVRALTLFLRERP